MPHPTPPLNRKFSPTPYLSSKWKKTSNAATWRWDCSPQATLDFISPSGDVRYFMAEVSALSKAQTTHPQTITITINDVLIEVWTIDATTLHDKLVIIPLGMIQKGKPVTITLALTHPHNANTEDIGLNLHSISLHATLDDYLMELQTGYNWACGLRNELLETIRRVLHFLANIDAPPPQFTVPLKAILQDPFVLARHEATLIFDEQYFHSNLAQLKEGRIHQAVRQWAADIKTLQGIVVDAGNYATSRPEIRCWDQAGLNAILPPPLEFTEKIATLRAKNTTLNNLEILLSKDKIDSVPPILYLDITNRCNFRCRMCYQSTSHFLRQNLINDHMAIVLTMLPYLTEITVAGLGEPLLSKNLLSLAERARTLHCATTIITNGSLISANIHILKNFSTVSISFDGAEDTTFETLRNRSNFKQITSNIKKLRKEAPDITLAFSVVLSRANLDEFTGIVQWAADLGINIVNISPLEHMPFFELKKSDFLFFQGQLAEAKRITEQAGITLSVAIGSQNFSGSNDSPRDKKNLINELSTMRPAPEQTPRLEAIAQGFNSVPFNYYPDLFVFSNPTCLQITDQDAPTNFTGPFVQSDFDVDFESSRLDEKINACLVEIRDSPTPSLSVPYCLDPWKLNYIKSNGMSRLCCHTDHIVGDLGNHGFKKAITSHRYCHIRQTMTGLQPMLPACKQCRAVDRALGLESINDTCRAYSIPFTATIDFLDSNNGDH